MFEALKSTPPSLTADIIVAASPGYGVLFFAPKPQAKPAASLLAELIRENTFPVLGWRVRGDMMLPLTLCDPPAGAVVFLSIGQQKHFALDGSGRSWSSFDLFHEHLMQLWRTQRREAEPKPQLSGTTQFAIEAGASVVAIPRTTW